VRSVLIPLSVVLVLMMPGCGNSSIVGKWRMSGTEDQTVWEFSSNGSVLAGELQIETPFATTVYVVNLSNDQLVLQDLGGSKLEFTRIR